MRADIERAFDEEGRRAARASFLSANLPKLVGRLKGTQIGMCFVNQIRQRANAMPFQDPNYEPGGMALAHLCHVILRMRPLGQIGRGEDSTGVKARVTARKNKLAPPFRTADLAIMFDGTITEVEEE